MVKRLSDVSRGMEWDAIIERWHGAITKEAIAEAVELASEALMNHQMRRGRRVSAFADES